MARIGTACLLLLVAVVPAVTTASQIMPYDIAPTGGLIVPHEPNQNAWSVEPRGGVRVAYIPPAEPSKNFRRYVDNAWGSRMAALVSGLSSGPMMCPL